jgi:hypothetical protein
MSEPPAATAGPPEPGPTCPVCGAAAVGQRCKLVCSRCRVVIENCNGD